jgi:hypothetical protein
MRFPLLAAVCALALGAQPTAQVNLAAQREGMKKLSFLAGKWSGDGVVVRGPGQQMKLHQTEDIQYKLDGLVMLIEGTGRNPEGQVVFRALATVSYDDAASKYRWRAYSEGRYLETELKVSADGFSWGFDAGPVKVANIMNLTADGKWHEITEITAGNSPPRKTLDMTLSKLP